MLSLQLIMLYSLVAIGIIYVTAASSLAITARETERQPVPRERSRCPFIRNSLVNGRVKIRSRGRIAKFICNNGYELVGRRFATCVRGQWNNPIPICVTNGCPVINNPANGKINIQISDALVTFSCDAGYILRGSETAYCNGASWNDTAPVCDIATTSPELTCDFEDPNICGWSHDRYHNFDWRRHQFMTPSGHVGTGPSYDHTLGKNNDGYYMYTEASPPRVINDSARLFSPVYFPETTPSCFLFWYHMFGATTGSLRIYLKKESQVFKELFPVWERTGTQGNLWLQGYVSIPELKENFQIVIEGIRGSGYVGDTAIDDVAVYSTPCEDLVVANITRGADSCKNRCFPEEDVNTTCHCKESCKDVIGTCCDDFEYFCTDSANRTDVGLFSIEPSLKRMSTPGKLSPLPVETFHAATLTPESIFTSLPPPIINTSEAVVSPSINVSSNMSDQTALAQSPSLTPVTVAIALTNETLPLINRSIPIFPEGLTTVASSSIVNISVGTNKAVLNTTTASQTTTVSPSTATINEITSTSSVTTKQIFTPLPSVYTSISTSTPEIIKSTMLSSKLPIATNSASTRVWPIKTTESTRSSTSTTTTWTVPQSTTSKPVIPPILTTTAPSTAPLTSHVTLSTQSSTNSTRLTSHIQERKSNSASSTEPSSMVSIKTSSPITDKVTSKLYTTSRQQTSSTPLPSKSSTFAYYKNTEKPVELSVTESSRKTTISLGTTSGTSEAKTSFNYPRESQPLILRENTSTTPKALSTSSTPIAFSTTTPQKRTSVYCPEGSLRFQNGGCFPPWTNHRYPSEAVVTPTTTNSLKSSSLITETTSIPSKSTELSNTKALRKQPLPIPSKFSTDFSNPSTITYETIEMLSTWKPDFKSRTKYRSHLQKPLVKSPVPITMIVAVTVGAISALVLIILVRLYISFKKRRVAQSKLSDDSEMRFLSDSEIVEFADASTKLNSDSG